MWRSALRWTGEIAITLGVILALFVVYLLWWTGLETAGAQRGLRAELDRNASTVAVPAAHIDPPPAIPAVGKPYLRIESPALGEDWSWVVVEGVDLPQLALGPGHYPGTAGPGEVGNFAVAGHRAGHAAPFENLDRLKPGDVVVFSFGESQWTYRVDRSFLTEPTDVGVIAAVPGQPHGAATKRLMTLTTCDPKYGVRFKRLIVVGTLIEEH
ncbi:class E sortase [Mycobacterium sp. M26]|uniref:class E sortase n=1 Tax=Mycobacterium sp. M26 TaxID=1762962 RepID=UPI00073E6CE7|nr:class E sortase [Mycobacterium sp. M26]